MNYQLLQDVISLVQEFEEKQATHNYYSNNIDGFKKWILSTEFPTENYHEQTNWEGKENGRTPESMINTLIVHMNRYAKSYSKSIIANSKFTSQDEFVYLIVLKSLGQMSKIELIKKNVQEKSVGILTINNLIRQGWVKQVDSLIDKRSKLISITPEGISYLEYEMKHIRRATLVVTANLSEFEKYQLIRLLKKLDTFHHKVFEKNYQSSNLLHEAFTKYLELEK